MGRRPLRGENSQGARRETLRFRVQWVVKPFGRKNEKGVAEGRCFHERLSDGNSPKDEKSRESNCPRPELILRGAIKGNGFPSGIKPLKRRWQVEMFAGKAQERRGKGKLFSDHLEGAKL